MTGACFRDWSSWKASASNSSSVLFFLSLFSSTSMSAAPLSNEDVLTAASSSFNSLGFTILLSCVTGTTGNSKCCCGVGTADKELEEEFCNLQVWSCSNAAMLEEMPLHCAEASLLAKLSFKLFAVSSNLSKASSYFFSELCKCLSKTHDSSAQPHISLLWPPNWPYPRKSSQEVRLDKLCSQMPGCKTVDCQFSIYFSSHGISIRKIELKYQYFHNIFIFSLKNWICSLEHCMSTLSPNGTSLSIDR